MNFTGSKLLPLIHSKSTLIRACSGKTPSTQPSEDVNSLKMLHKVNNLERRFLVWTKKYKTVEEVPNFVGQGIMERARNRMRIKIANYMIVATLLGCCAMVYLGKQDQKQGKSLTQMNLDWHRQIKEEDEKQKAAAAATKG